MSNQSVNVLDLTEVERQVTLDFEALMSRYGIPYVVQFIDDNAFYFEVHKDQPDYIVQKMIVSNLYTLPISSRGQHTTTFKNGSRILQSSQNLRLFLVLSSHGRVPTVPSPLTLYDVKAQDVDKEQASIDAAYKSADSPKTFQLALANLGYRDTATNANNWWRNYDGSPNRMGHFLFLRKGSITVVIDVSTGDFDIANQL